MNIEYELTYKDKRNSYNNVNKFKNIKDLKNFIINSEKNKNIKILEITKLYLIYEHTKNFNFKPIIINDLGIKREVYNEIYKLNIEDLKPIFVSNYKNNLINNNNNFLIKYLVLDKSKHYNNSDFNYYEKVTINYNSNDLKEIKNRLRILSKSRQCFNIILYQYDILYDLNKGENNINYILNL